MKKVYLVGFRGTGFRDTRFARGFDMQQPIYAQTDVQLLDTLETKLGHLAARWRGTDNPQEAESLVRQYQAVLRCMIELGYHDSLDVDAELPDELMPAEYLNLFG